MQKYDKKQSVKFLVLCLFVVIMIIITVLSIPFIKSLSTAEGRIEIQNYVESYGAFSIFMFVGLQVIQIVIAFIPGEPIEILGGVLFGGFFGFLLCLSGILIGTVLVYYIVKLLGRPFVELFFDDKKISKLKILNDERKLEVLVFVLFLVPGTPKDILTYFVPLTKIKPTKYFLYSTIARTPSVISSTFVGSNIGKGQWGVSIIIFAITAAIGFVGIMYNDKIVNNVKKHKNDFNKNSKHIK